MRIKRLLISAVAVLGLSALGLSPSANAAAPSAGGAGHDPLAAKAKSTFTLISRRGSGGYRGGLDPWRGGFVRPYAFAAPPVYYGGYSFRRTNLHWRQDYIGGWGGWVWEWPVGVGPVGWSGRNCHWKCRAAGYRPGYCRMYAYNFCY